MEASASHTYHRKPLHEKAAFHYLLLILVLASLAVSIFALVNANGLMASSPQTISINDFLAKLTAHNEMKSYVGIAPLNIMQINGNNLASLQAQINGLDISHIGSFIVLYQDAIVVYDYNNDMIKDTVALQQPQQKALPGDFFTKLNAHPELAGLENEQPLGGQLDQQSLDTLKQQFPTVYANAKIGDFRLIYSTKLVIYDYDNDVVVNDVSRG